MDSNTNIKLTVAIPTYTYPEGLEHLRQSFEILKQQTFKDFEVVVSDDSLNDDVRDFCASYEGLSIRYIRNLNQRGMGGNTNTAIQYSSGELIKILYQDDYLTGPDSLQKIVDAFKPEDTWLATGCSHTNLRNHIPLYNEQIYRGINTIGSPSVITLRNKDLPLFDTKLSYVLDCDFYKQLFDKFGPPKLLNDINVMIRLGSHQTTNKLSDEIKNSEIRFLIEKYS